MIDTLILRSKLVIAYLGDAAHRRFAATLIALGLTYILGQTFSASDIAGVIEIVIGGLGGAWSSSTPDIDGSSGDA